VSLPAGQGDRDARRAARVPAQSPLAYGFLRVVGLSALVPLFRLKTVGRENVPAEGPVVLASLHRSNWDSLAVGVLSGSGSLTHSRRARQPEREDH
jgi:1-acyl-sn-glycerol-3-phosphate acyltransferase